ncbi:MAG: DNA starvation/stationary phase protection protein Dps [Candidatus Melainabacteria bacterium]
MATPGKALTMHATTINLPEDKRVRLVDHLNLVLAHLSDLKLAVKHAHWNVKGMHFIALHELFDTLAGELDGLSDTTAERATTLGGTALGTLQAIHTGSTLEPYPPDATAGEAHLKALVSRYAQVGKLVRQAIDEAEELEDKDTADLFTEVSRALDMRLWFLEAHLQA